MNVEEIKVKNIKTDVIVKFEMDEKIKTICFFLEHINKWLEKKSCDHMSDLVKYYLGTKKTIKILKITKYMHISFKREDFDVKILTRRRYSNATFLYVKIYNKKTKVVFEDWVKPFQIKSAKEINKLICWEKEGEEIEL